MQLLYTVSLRRYCIISLQVKGGYTLVTLPRIVTVWTELVTA
jgi:hypothetical protein